MPRVSCTSRRQMNKLRTFRTRQMSTQRPQYSFVIFIHSHPWADDTDRRSKRVMQSRCNRNRKRSHSKLGRAITCTCICRRSYRQRRWLLRDRRGCSGRSWAVPCGWRYSMAPGQRPAGYRWPAPVSQHSASRRGAAAGTHRRSRTPGSRLGRGSIDPSRSRGRTPTAGTCSSASRRHRAGSRRAGRRRSTDADAVVAVYPVVVAAAASSWHSTSVPAPTPSVRQSLLPATVVRVRCRLPVPPRRSVRDSLCGRLPSLWPLSLRRIPPTSRRRQPTCRSAASQQVASENHLQRARPRPGAAGKRWREADHQAAVGDVELDVWTVAEWRTSPRAPFDDRRTTADRRRTGCEVDLGCDVTENQLLLCFLFKSIHSNICLVTEDVSSNSQRPYTSTVLAERKPPPRRLTSNEDDPGFPTKMLWFHYFFRHQSFFRIS